MPGQRFPTTRPKFPAQAGKGQAVFFFRTHPYLHFGLDVELQNLLLVPCSLLCLLLLIRRKTRTTSAHQQTFTALNSPDLNTSPSSPIILHTSRTDDQRHFLARAQLLVLQAPCMPSSTTRYSPPLSTWQRQLLCLSPPSSFRRCHS